MRFRTALVVWTISATAVLGADFDFSVWTKTSPGVTDEEAKEVLAAGQDILEEADGPEDVECLNEFLLAPPIHVGADDPLPANIWTPDDWKLYINDDRFSIYVVDSINWCGQPANGGIYAGCARKGGPIAIAADYFTPVVVTHEIGHAQGNPHNQTLGFLMYPVAHGTNKQVNTGECDKFLLGKLFPVVPDDFAFDDETDDPMPAMVEPPSVPLDFLLEGVWHQPPLELINALTAEDIDLVRDELAGEASGKWANAVTILALRGEPMDFALLETAIIEATLALNQGIPGDGVPWRSIRANAEIGLGMLFNRTGDLATLNLLREFMLAPEASVPEANLSSKELEDISRTAAIGFAHAGPEATLAFPAALALAEIGNLQIAQVFSADGPIVASAPDVRDSNTDPTTFPSLATAENSDIGLRTQATDAINSIDSFYAMVDGIKRQVDGEGLDAYLTD